MIKWNISIVFFFVYFALVVVYAVNAENNSLNLSMYTYDCFSLFFLFFVFSFSRSCCSSLIRWFYSKRCTIYLSINIYTNIKLSVNWCDHNFWADRWPASRHLAFICRIYLYEIPKTKFVKLISDGLTDQCTITLRSSLLRVLYLLSFYFLTSSVVVTWEKT